MAISKQSLMSLEKGFEDILENDTNEINDALLSNDEYKYESIVKTALLDEGYPEEASYRTVGTSLEITSKISYEDWANRFIEDNDINDSEEVDTFANNEAELVYYILDYLYNKNIEVEFIDYIEVFNDMIIYVI